MGAENIGPKREEVTGEWRKVHNQELHNLDSSPNRPILMVIKSRTRYAGHAARMGTRHTQFWWKILKGRNQMED
jgi:hypothetical protein